MRSAASSSTQRSEQDIVDAGLWMTAANNFEENADVYHFEQ